MEKLKIGEKLDKLWLYSLLAEGYNTYDIISNYKLDEGSNIQNVMRI